MQHWGTYKAKGNHRAEAPRQECTCPTEEQQGGQGTGKEGVKGDSRGTSGQSHGRARLVLGSAGCCEAFASTLRVLSREGELCLGF